MKLSEIRNAARKLREKHGTGTMGLDYDVWSLAGLVEELAARMQEFKNLMIQSRKIGEAFKGTETYRKAQEQVYGVNARGNEAVCTATKFKAKMKTHQVTVQYRATVDMNDEIVSAIWNVHPTVHDGILVYMRITSDRDGV